LWNFKFALAHIYQKSIFRESASLRGHVIYVIVMPSKQVLYLLLQYQQIIWIKVVRTSKSPKLDIIFPGDAVVLRVKCEKSGNIRRILFVACEKSESGVSFG
jgi:hypothetical protein